MVNAVGTRRTHIQRGNPEVLKENGVIRAAAQITHGHVGGQVGYRAAALRPSKIWRNYGGTAGLLRLLAPLIVKHAALGTRHRLGHIADELFQAGTGRSAEVAPR